LPCTRVSFRKKEKYLRGVSFKKNFTLNAPIHNEFRLITISFIKNPRNAGASKIKTEQKKIAKIRRKIKEDNTLK
jgi:hypothetical protein